MLAPSGQAALSAQRSNEFDDWSVLSWGADGNLLVSNTGRLLKLGADGQNQTQLLADSSPLIDGRRHRAVPQQWPSQRHRSGSGEEAGRAVRSRGLRGYRSAGCRTAIGGRDWAEAPRADRARLASCWKSRKRRSSVPCHRCSLGARDWKTTSPLRVVS